MDIKRTSDLNPREDRFCYEFIIDLNGTKAAIRAKYSEKTARVKASQLLAKVNIQTRIKELMKKREKRTEITQDRVLEELAILAYSDFRNYGEIIKELGIDRLKLKTFKDIKGGATRAIKSISEKISKDGVQLIFTLHGKTQAVELLGKHLGMFIEKIEHSGKLEHAVFMMPRPKNKKKKEKNAS